MVKKGSVLLVGSVPLDNATDVFKTCSSALGDRVKALPDGEVGDRTVWVIFQTYRIFDGHPQLETLHRPRPVPGKPDWIPSGLDDMWRFRVKPGEKEVEFGELGYCRAAIESYGAFRALRGAGEIPAGTRFQVSLPTPLGGSAWFFHEPGDYERVYGPYRAAMKRELASICAQIPNQDLAIQWDVCWEVLEIERTFTWALAMDPWRRWVEEVEVISPGIPRQAQLGYHFCYADLGHRHMKQPADLGTAVKMANQAVAHSGRPVDWIHVPVPRDRHDDAYFAPLRELQVESTAVYLGLIHHTDGVEGTLERVRAAKKHLAGFGVATECGFGRRHPATLPELLRIHNMVADTLEEIS